MTYRELAEKVAAMTEEQKDSDVTIYDHETEEFYKAENYQLNRSDEDDRLNDGHPFLTIK